MQPARRQFLADLVGAGMLLALPLPALAGRPSASVGPLAHLPPPSPEVHLLRRISFGIRRDELARLQAIGVDRYLDEQFDWTALDDSVLEAELDRRYSTLRMSPCEIAKLKDPNLAVSELTQAYFLRSAYSTRQLYEVMVDFWSDHFNIDVRKSFCNVLKSSDDREVIRPHALGYFRDLLHASARSPAMLVYLDNWLNVAAGPNQNYARELMELHTLSVDGGYTEEDVQAVADCFTGWTLRAGEQAQACATTMRGEFVFQPTLHADAAKRVLGRDFPAGQGMADGDQVLDLLTDHPATARHIALKLTSRFVSDEPPSSLISRLADAWGRDGDVRAMLKVIFGSREFRDSADEKFQRPWQHAAAVLRALEAPPPEPGGLGELYSRMLSQGQAPYAWPAPNGYPDAASHWLTANGLLERWRLSIDGAGVYPSGVMAMLGAARSATDMVDVLSDAILHRPLISKDRDAMIAAAQRNFGGDPAGESALPVEAAVAIAAALFASSYFQVR